MLDIKIVNGKAEKAYCEGRASEIMDELENVVASILYDIIEQGGFDREDLEETLEMFANNIQVTFESIEKIKKLC